jgi:hypothetical protein
MALIPCPECGRRVSDRAQACPGCGYPPDRSPARPVVPPPASDGAWLRANAREFDLDLDQPQPARARPGWGLLWATALLGLAVLTWHLAGWATPPLPWAGPAAGEPRPRLAGAQTAAISTPAPAWDTAEMDITKNRNVQLAVGLIRSGALARSEARSAQASDVARAPLDYIGSISAFQGTVALVQEYGPTSTVSQNLAPGATISEVVLTDHPLATGVPVDFLMLGTSGSVRQGDLVSVSGYVAGFDRVTTSTGGQTTQLVVVGEQVRTLQP